MPIITALLFFMAMPVWSAGPMIDGYTLDISQSGAVNSIRDGKFSDAILGEEKALKIDEELKGPLHPSLVSLYDNLGTLYCYVADYVKAEKDYKWALALTEQSFGANDPNIAGPLEYLAGLYNDMSRLAEAELAAKRALTLRESDPSLDPLILAQTQCLLGQIELNFHKYSQAQELLQKALTAAEKSSPVNPDFSIALLNLLARTCQLENNATQAQSCLEKSLNISQKNFHADDIRVSDAMTRLADFFHGRGSDQKAQSLYASAFKIDQRYVGSVYTYQSLPYLKRMAKAYFTTGDIQSSETLWLKTLQTEKEVYNPNHPQVALDLIQLAQVESASGKKQEAAKNLKQSIEILKGYFSDDHPLIVQAQTQLGKLEK